MSISTPIGTSYAERATSLVVRVDQDSWGSVSPSLYETARVLSAAPWLPEEPRRITYLLEQQASDGSWGEGPLPYRLLPTLSGVEAALAVLRRGTASAEVTGRLTAAVNRGLDALRSLPSAGPRPDTAAAEILVPSLVAKINEKLDSLITGGDIPGFGGPQLPVPGASTRRHLLPWPGGTSRRAACPSSFTTRSRAWTATYHRLSSLTSTACWAARRPPPRHGQRGSPLLPLRPSMTSPQWRSATTVSSPRPRPSAWSNGSGSPPRWRAPTCPLPLFPLSVGGPRRSTIRKAYAVRPAS